MSTATSARIDGQQFPSCDREKLRLYPIVETSSMVQYCAERGAKTIQLRIKNQSMSVINNEIAESVKIAAQYNMQLFINDYWQLAIEHNAYGVHLGQEDLTTANVAAIAAAGLRLGVSTHCVEEITPSLALKPSYLAYGPIYHTTSKDMKFTPRGLERLQHWCKELPYPIVAIGGITTANYEEVLATGASGVAFIGATKEFFV